MRIMILSTLVSCMLLVSACSSAPSSSLIVTYTPLPTQTPSPPSSYQVTLHALNNSGVAGNVALRLSGTTLQVTLHVTGLEPNQMHMQHIHGDSVHQSACPTPADADSAGIITVATTLQKAGPVAVDLVPYPAADAHGTVDWSQSINLERANIQGTPPLTQFVVVIHGMTYHGVYDGTFVVACGAITTAGA